MMQYFNAFGPQAARLRSESGTVSAISGILKAPFDIIGDKLRGFLGLTMDMVERPGKVLAACEALAPHLLHVALSSADPDRQVPVGFWMHRGCVPFVTPGQFASHYWPTLKPIIEELWAHGHQTLFYAEGNWNDHLDSFAELPDRSIVFHVDKGDIFEAHRRIGHKFCLSGGIPNVLLSFGTPEQVRDHCRKVIDGVARDGGYIADASAIMQNDTNPDNLRALTEAVREYGVYSSAPTEWSAPAPLPGDAVCRPERHSQAAGVCIPWEEKVRTLPPIQGDEDHRSPHLAKHRRARQHVCLAVPAVVLTLECGASAPLAANAREPKHQAPRRINRQSTARAPPPVRAACGCRNILTAR